MKRFLPWLVQGMFIALLALLIGCAVTALSSCRTCSQTAYVAEVSQADIGDTLHLISLRVDSVIVRDSVFTMVRGDSVLVERWHREYRDRLRVDTVAKLKTKTIYVTRTEKITVSPKKPPWYSLSNLIKIIVSVFAGFMIGSVAMKIYYKFRRRK